MGLLRICGTSVGALWISLMVNFSLTAATTAQQTSEPIIYVTLTRWENRTFSPRIYYLLMQKYGLQNKLLDLSRNTYNEYETVPKGNRPPGANGVLKPKPFLDPGLFGTRSAFPIINSHRQDGNFVSTRKQLQLQASPVVFPTNEALVGIRDGFFRDRIAYPGSSARRTVGNSLGHRKNFVPPNVFGAVPTSSGIFGTSDADSVDTLSLTLDIVNKNDWQDENVVFSPFSITNILAMLLLGSNGTTHDEIAARLRPLHPFTSSETEKESGFHSAFQNLLSFLNRGSDDKVVIDVCNKIIIDKKYPVMSSYRKDAISYYEAQSEVFDFATQSEELTKAVNRWVSFKTQGKIPTVLDAPPNPATALVLINALYFKGTWETPFIPEITQRKPFYVSPSETVDVAMMTNILTVPYFEAPEYRVIGLPYKGQKTGLFVFLPKLPGVKGLQELESQLNIETLKRLNELKLTQVTIQLPKMRIESEGNIKDVLSKFGLQSLFNPKSANFSRISDTPGLFVSSIVHKAVFEMNEKGTEAAAATVVTGDRTLDERPVLFAVNRPFLFAIYNVKAQTVLFFGRVTRPLPLAD